MSTSDTTTSASGGFNPNQTPDSTQTVDVNYLPMGLTGVLLDSQNSFITAICGKSSTPNVTYSNSAGQQQYKASHLWIVGNSTGTNYPLHTVQGVAPTSVNGELIIKNVNSNGDKLLYTCYLLCVTSTGIPGAEQVDNILNVTAQNNTLTVDLNAAINSKPVTKPVYIQYASSTGATVLVYSQPIWITSVNVFALQNNLGLFDMPMPSPASNYSIIALNVPGSWMECDYVPIDGGEVAAYNLPVSSDLVKSNSTVHSLQTIIWFIVFFFLCMLSYFMVPAIYLGIVYRLLKMGGNEAISEDAKRKRIWWIDVTISGILGGIAFILICVGAFAPANKVTNSGDILLSGFCIGIIYIVSYIIVQSKKTSGDFIDGVDYRNK